MLFRRSCALLPASGASAAQRLRRLFCTWYKNEMQTKHTMFIGLIQNAHLFPRNRRFRHTKSKHLPPKSFDRLFKTDRPAISLIRLFGPQTKLIKTEKVKVKPWSQGWLIAAGAYPGFCSMKRLEVFLLPQDGMLVHRRSLPCNFVTFPQQIAGTHLYTWVERGTMRVKCLAQDHNTLSPARAQTRTARYGVERTNHDATAPKTLRQRQDNSPHPYQVCLVIDWETHTVVYFGKSTGQLCWRGFCQSTVTLRNCQSLQQ